MAQFPEMAEWRALSGWTRDELVQRMRDASALAHPVSGEDAWARAGFEILGTRYQRAWHRLAHAHLKSALRIWSEADRRALGSAPPHEVAATPVQLLAQKALKPARVPATKEEEHVRRGRFLTAAVAFAAIAVAFAGSIVVRKLRRSSCA
jgi:hypothetical protein